MAVADLGGRSGAAGREDRVFSGVPLDPAGFRDVLAPLVEQTTYVDWDDSQERFVAERRRVVGELVLEASPLEEVPQENRNQALLRLLRHRGLDLLPWTRPLRQWRARVALLAGLEREQVGASDDVQPRWPDLSDATLLDTLEEWLLPFLGPVSRLSDFNRLDLRAILQAQLPWPLPLELERQAPERLAVPTGSSIAIDYLQDPPVLAVKLQEMFGCEDTPRIADGRVAVVLHLLSPAGRPLQVTQDLGSFWRGAYDDVKREMKGRYPKHPWPDDPLSAQATRFTRNRSR
jgi:ATP-dependent helicase HrpB